MWMQCKRKILPLMVLALLLTGCGAPAAKAETTAPETTAAETTVPETTAAPATEPTAEPTTVPTEPPEERFLLTFAGDCTFGANPVNYFAGFGFIKTVGEDYRYPFRNVISWFENDECTFLNLEGPLSDEGNPMQKKHVFRGPTAYVKILTENSVEAVTLANNHSMDYGKEGYTNTIATLESAGVPYVETNSSTIITLDSGLSIGIYGTVYYSMDNEDMVAEITAMKEQGIDVIIYAPHWGAEGYYQPNRIQKEAAYAAVDAGAQIVWGTHPHVLQPIEEYNGGVIFYSLGNFAFGGNCAPKDLDTALIQQEISLQPDGSITLHSAWQNSLKLMFCQQTQSDSNDDENSDKASE